MNYISGLSPRLPVGTIFCIGRNYVDHARELKNEVPQEPVVFLKPRSAVITDGGTIVLPGKSKNVHHEVELLAAIGNKGKNISRSSALDYIAGLGVGIDVTARDIQQQAKNKSRPWTVAKGFDTFAPISTFLPIDQFKNPDSLNLSLYVNGEKRQQTQTELMIFPIDELVAYLSTIFTLEKGDIIFTGTPAGVSKIEPGDSLRASLDDDKITLNVSVKGEVMQGKSIQV